MNMKIIVLKLGYSETLDAKIDLIPSLGDVFRTTPILEAIKEKYCDVDITWVTDQAVTPLLRGIPLINRLLTWDSFLSSELLSEQFDVLINFEKTAAVCILADAIQAKKRYGFRYDNKSKTYTICRNAQEAKQMVTDSEYKQTNNKPWQQMLIEMIDCTWKEQKYQFGYKSCRDITHDVGFNYMVGSKWPNKAWPMERWKELEKLIAKELRWTVSWQEGGSNLDSYIEWIDSCGVLITNDSLGMHLAMALEKPVIALFGPTNDKEVHFYGHSTAIVAQTQCRPCYLSTCRYKNSCVGTIPARAVVERLQTLGFVPI